MPGTPEKEAEKLAQRILQQLRDAEIGPDKITITASIGVAQWHDEQKIDLIACADKAMYLAKTSGRDQIITWSKVAVIC
jgi:diguanylate cyclase (GGDEF)-like protein